MSNDEVLHVTFHSTPQSFNKGWGWRIPHNPERVPGQITKVENEVVDLADKNEFQTREKWTTVTYAYWAPFKYSNLEVNLGRPGTGVEFNPDGVELDIYPYGSIVLREDEPIVAVTVIGSGCSTDSYVVLEAEPLVWKYPRTAVRMRRDRLWGCHVRGDAFFSGKILEDWNDAGLSSARFDIPESKKVILGGGSHGADPHYCIRCIRVEVKTTGVKRQTQAGRQKHRTRSGLTPKDRAILIRATVPLD